MATKKARKGKRAEVETTGSAPVRVEDLPEPGTVHDDDEPEPEVALEPEAPKVEPAAEEPKEPTKAEIVAARRRTSPKAAAKHVAACLKMLALHDWPEIGIDGIAGAVAVLRSALPKLEAAATQRATFKLAPGSVARLRAKSAARWAGVLPAGVDLRVVELRKLSAVVEAPDGVRAIVAIREIDKGVVA